MTDDRVSTPRILIVVTTVGTQEQALDIANHLVDKRLAACVNIVPGVRSIFRWKGEVIDDTEFLLLAKTVEERYEEVSAAIKSLHAYELPEILAYPAPLADGPFAAWVGGATNRVEGNRGRPRK